MDDLQEIKARLADIHGEATAARTEGAVDRAELRTRLGGIEAAADRIGQKVDQVAERVSAHEARLSSADRQRETLFTKVDRLEERLGMNVPEQPNMLAFIPAPIWAALASVLLGVAAWFGIKPPE